MTWNDSNIGGPIQCTSSARVGAVRPKCSRAIFEPAQDAVLRPAFHARWLVFGFQDQKGTGMIALSAFCSITSYRRANDKGISRSIENGVMGLFSNLCRLELLRFKNDKITIKAGQTVEWNNEDPVTPHTVTFGMEPPNLMVPSGNVTVDPDGAVHGTISSMGENLHSGFIIAAPQERLGIPQAPLGNTRFRVTFKNPGTFNYICALHDDLGMTGMVIVYP